MEKEVLDQITLKMGIISGFIFLAIITPLKIYWRKKALKKMISSLLDDEEIIYRLEFLFVNDYIVPFGCGAFFGMYLLPFALFENITNIGLVNREHLSYFILAEIIYFLAVLYIASWEGGITNKKIRRPTAFLIFNKLGEKMNLLMDLDINEIKSTMMEKYWSSKAVKILTNNNKIYSFGGYKNMDEIKLCIDNLINIPPN